MATVTVSSLYDRIRSAANLYPHTTTTTTTSADVAEAADRTISDAFLLHHINQAQKLIVSSVKAFHVLGLVTSLDGTPAEYNALETNNRLLHGRVHRRNDSDPVDCGAVRCRYREVAEHVSLENAGRASTATYPVYTYDDDVLAVYPSSDRVLAYYVDDPTELTAGGDTLAVDHRFVPSIVAYVVAQIFLELDEDTKHTIWFDLYKRRIQPFLRTVRIAPTSKLVGPIQQETEVEIE